MSMVTPLHAAAAPQSPQSASLRKAAEGFEAIFVRQILASARQSSLGGEDLFGSQANDTFTQMRDERFADIAASTGAFGLARQLEVQLARALPASASASGSDADATIGKGSA